MRIVDGRDFMEAERTGPPVVVVNETMARLGWSGRSPIGEIVCSSPLRQQTCATVVGVVADAITFRLVGEEPRPYYYRPLAPDESESRALLVRMAPNARRMDGALRQALLELDANLPYASIETLGEALDPQIRPWRLGAAVFTAFGMLAIALAIAGLWSSVSYAVSQRTNEFAIRLAIGAGRTSLVTLVLGDGVRTAAIAVGAGIIIAAIASGFIADLLFEVSPRDPAVFGGIAGAVLAVATLASLLPAWRATRIQPVEALRAD
jgi:F0F1-type ATP synthase membrane subunit c/vacuolar-type H+-ATPase subunit K